MTNWNHNQFKYANLASAVTLAANTVYYVVSQETSGGDNWSDAPTTITPTSIAVINGKVSSTNSTVWDTTGGILNQAFGTVDFMYEGDNSGVKSPTLGTVRNNLTSWVGMKFTVGDQAVTVRSLGRIFRTGNTGTHAVKIVRTSDNTQIGSVSIPMTGGTNNKFKYVNLATPVTLTANTSYYLVSQETSGADQWYDSNTTIVPNGAITVNGRVSSTNGTTTWDNTGAIANQIYGPVNLIYESGSTPSALGVNLKGKLDFTNVGLMGHSRGGEGARAANYLYETNDLPWTTPVETTNPWKDSLYRRIRTPMTIKGIFEFAPTDYASTLINVSNKPWTVVLPACDGDLIDMPGVRPFDRMYYNTTETTNNLKSTIFIYGANHNFFNTQWQESEGLAACTGEGNIPLFASPNTPGITGSGYGSTKQQKTGLSSFLAFFRANIGSGATPSLNQTFNPRYTLPTSLTSQTKIDRGFTSSLKTTDALVFNNLMFSSAVDIDKDLCNPSVVTTPAKNVVCSSNSATTIQSSIKTIQNGPTGNYQDAQDHDVSVKVASVTWHSIDAPSRYFQVNAANGTFVNANTFQTLDFRISRRRNDTITSSLLPNSKNPTGPGKFTNLSVQLIMNDGKISAPVSLSKYLRLDGPVGLNVVSVADAPGKLHPILQSVRIPLSDFIGADITQIKSVRFLFNDTPTGAIFLSGLRFLK
jgi:hypothetical protein